MVSQTVTLQVNDKDAVGQCKITVQNIFKIYVSIL